MGLWDLPKKNCSRSLVGLFLAGGVAWLPLCAITFDVPVVAQVTPETVIIGKELEHIGTETNLVYCIDKIVKTKTNPENPSRSVPNGVSFVVVHYRISNRGHSPEAPSRTRFAIMTDENSEFRFTTQDWISEKLAFSFKVLQPGLELQNLTAVFEIPDQHLRKPLSFHVSNSSIERSLDFHFKDAILSKAPVQRNKMAAPMAATRPSSGPRPTSMGGSGDSSGPAPVRTSGRLDSGDPVPVAMGGSGRKGGPAAVRIGRNADSSGNGWSSGTISNSPPNSAFSDSPSLQSRGNQNLTGNENPSPTIDAEAEAERDFQARLQRKRQEMPNLPPPPVKQPECKYRTWSGYDAEQRRRFIKLLRLPRHFKLDAICDITISPSGQVIACIVEGLRGLPVDQAFVEVVRDAAHQTQFEPLPQSYPLGPTTRPHRFNIIDFSHYDYEIERIERRY